MQHEKLTLHSVDVRLVEVPLKRSVISRVGVFDWWPVVLIDLDTEQGITGQSYLEPYLKQSMKYIKAVIEDIAASRAGKQISPLIDFLDGRRGLNLVGHEGLSMIAISGLDMAAWDALSRSVRMPLARFLGGDIGPVPAYNSNGLWLSSADALAGEATELVNEGGFAALKLRLGRDRVEDDLRAIKIVRAEVGADIKLMVDFNQGLTFGDALHRCHALDGEGLHWFEEPTTYTNLVGHAQLARELKTPIQIGENFYGPRELARAISAGAADYVMPDLMRIGGVSGWMRSVPVAAAAGIEVSTHLYPEVSAHLMRITETAHWLEWQDWVNPILAEPFELANGSIVIPDRLGSGITWNEDAVSKFASDA